jgi:hypothetical protein
VKLGFQLRALRVVGKGKEPAELSFGPGCNVIAGASNTGKSYILQCIDFACGAGAPPKTITESIGYELVEMEFEDPSATRHKFERSLKGANVRHSIWTEDKWVPAGVPVLGSKHSAIAPNTISGFLLQLSKLWGKEVRINQSGHVDSLSFRDVAHLTFIDEKRIIDDASPIFTGNNSTQPKEVSIFNLFLTGVDDRSVIALETQKQNQARRKAQLDLLDRLISRTEEQIEKADKEPMTVSERRSRVDEAILQRTQIVTANQNELAGQEKRRHAAWEQVQTASAKYAATEQLKTRFKILEDHYNNDVARLNAIVEADYFFSQLEKVRCPLCGAAAEDHDATAHDAEDASDLQSLRIACKQEIQKIQGLLKDLVGTTQQLDNELTVLQQEQSLQNSLFNEATTLIQKELSPRAEQLQGELSGLLETRDALAYTEMLQERLQSYRHDREVIAKDVWKKQPIQDDGQQSILVPQAIEAFSLNVEALLKEWRYPGLTRVTFNNERFDLIISGKDRASEGKGFRAIAYSAFMIGLLRYCLEKGLPHPGVVVLDSPLVTYKRRDTQPNEAIPEDVGRAFYEALSKTSDEQQIIILENEDPPEDVRPLIKHYIHFSRLQGVGRYGFFPEPKVN